MPSGPRIRTNNVFGTVSDNPLTNVATTLNSNGLANLAAVSSAHAVLVLDPLRAAGAPEIVIVTAHTGSATSATITRGAYGTSARQHAQGTLWVHAPTIDDVIRIVTSSTRPSDPYEGQHIYETDTNRDAVYDGAAWLPGALVAVVTSSTRPASPFEGQTIYETDTDRVLVWNGTNWTQYRLGQEPDRFFNVGLSNGTATSFTDFATNNSILALPYPYTMVVMGLLNSGANVSANIVTVQVRDEAGASINVGKTVIDIDWPQSHSASSQYQAWSVLGKKDYAAGATCGFRLAYKVSTSNIFIDGGARVSFLPRV